MSESTEELNTAVKGVTETLKEVETLAEHLSGQATELSEEAAGHGWYGMATRMQEVGDALQATTAQIGISRLACEKASTELGLINDKIPSEEVVTHLTTSATELTEAVSAFGGAVEKADEAKTAAGEIGQQGMMQATLDLYDQLTELREKLTEQRDTSEQEQASAQEYEKKNLGNWTRVAAQDPHRHPEIHHRPRSLTHPRRLPGPHRIKAIHRHQAMPAR